jgi:ferric iron reductase protein FhuF
MATHTAHIVEPPLASALTSGNASLADAIRDKIAETRAHLLDFIRLDEAHPNHAMTLSEWRQPSKLQSLLATYSDHIYRNQPTLTRENKPLLSLGAVVYRADGASAHAGAVNPEEHAGTLAG